MKALLAVLSIAIFIAGYPQGSGAGDGKVRFESVDVVIESDGRALAAYQFTFRAKKGEVEIVGVEGGDHPAFSGPPYYDPKALQQGRIKIAAFSMAKELPTGRTRVARLHLQVIGQVDPDYSVVLDAAASPEGKEIPVTITVAKGKSDAR